MKKFIAATAVLVAVAGGSAAAVAGTVVDDAGNSLKQYSAKAD